jgi:hypothetical protein
MLLSEFADVRDQNGAGCGFRDVEPIGPIGIGRASLKTLLLRSVLAARPDNAFLSAYPSRSSGRTIKDKKRGVDHLRSC